MNHRMRTLTATVAAITSAATLAACGGSGASNGNTTAATSVSGTPAATTAGGVDPNAPEVNPAGDIPDNQVFVDYTYDPGGYHVKVPEGWARADAGGQVTFTDKLNSVSMTSQPATTAPTVGTAKADEVPAIEGSDTNVAITDVTSIQRSGGTAILVRYLRDGAPDPVTGKVVRQAVERYEIFKDGTEAILTLSGPLGADNVDPWMIVSDSFGWS